MNEVEEDLKKEREKGRRKKGRKKKGRRKKGRRKKGRRKNGKEERKEEQEKRKKQKSFLSLPFCGPLELRCLRSSYRSFLSMATPSLWPNTLS